MVVQKTFTEFYGVQKHSVNVFCFAYFGHFNANLYEHSRLFLMSTFVEDDSLQLLNGTLSTELPYSKKFFFFNFMFNIMWDVSNLVSSYIEFEN